MAATTLVNLSARRVIVAWDVGLDGPPGWLLQVDLFQAAAVGLKVVVYLKPNIRDMEVAEDIVTAGKKTAFVYAVAIICSWGKVSGYEECKACLKIYRQ